MATAILLGGTCLQAQTYTRPSPYAPPRVVRAQSPPPLHTMAEEPAAGEQVVEVRVLGHHQIPIKKILPLIKTRANRQFDPRMIEEDVHRLNGSRMFLSVKPKYERVAGGRVVVFEVMERPTLAHVKFVGNKEIKKKILAKEAKIAVGDPFDPHAVEEARRKVEDYYRSKGFAKVRITLTEGSRPTDAGAIFLINEGPKQDILWTKFVGNTIATDGRLRTVIKSKHGVLWLFNGEVDEKQIEEDANRLTAYYRSLGFFQAKIGRSLEYSRTPKLLAPLMLGPTPTWLTLTFVINEGPRYKVRSVTVQGNRKYSSQELLGLLELQTGDYFDQSKLSGDVASIQDRYGEQGYIFAAVKPDPRFMEEPGELDLIYDISEGRQCRVGRIDVNIDGEFPHTRLTTVLNRLSLKPGDIIDIRELRASERRLRSCGLFEVNPRNGVMPTIAFSPPTAAEIEAQERGVAERPNSPGRFRGQSPDPRPHTSYRPIEVGHGDGQDDLIYYGNRGPIPMILYSCPQEDDSTDATVPHGWRDRPAQPDVERLPPVRADQIIVRGQSPEPGDSRYPNSLNWTGGTTRRSSPPARHMNQDYAAPRMAGPASDSRHLDDSAWAPITPTSAYAGRPNGSASRRPQEPHPFSRSPRQVVRGQYSGDSGTAVPSLPSGQAAWRSGPPLPSSSVPRASAPSSSTTGQNSVIVDQAFGGGSAATAPAYAQQYVEPGQLPPPGSRQGSVPFFGNDRGLREQYVGQPAPLSGLRPHEEPPLDITLRPNLRETQTGSFMFSVGVNSDAGLLGSIIIDEQNFDWRRYPRGWSDIRDFTAFRGDGQRFRIEAVPGTQVQRYAVKFQEPYLLDTDVSLGLSGSFYSRRFQWWDEERLGGRVSLGYQFDNDLTGAFAFRAEKVNISNPVSYAPQDLLDVVGDSSLFGFRGQLTHDTRDNTFLATEGHLFQMGFEYVVGSYQYPRADVGFRKYFLMHQRPDSSGRHVLGLKTNVEITGDDTPLYEHYFAGGYSTIRGFDYRGASPRVNTVPVGGHFSMLASVEYIFPITADDMLRGVVFCDTGTVEPTIHDWTDKYRVAPGVGLRITVPAMGPAPIALDFAFPISNEGGDEVENFSFFVGFMK